MMPSTGTSGRGQWFTLRQAAAAYPIFSERLLRRLCQERRLPFSKAGRLTVVSEADLLSYLESNRTGVSRPLGLRRLRSS